MKAIIGGKRYDTETATEVGHYANSYYAGDFHHYKEVLYKTTAGAWFLQGEGGGLSKYGVNVGNNGSCAGSALVPLSAADAREWLENTKNIEALEQYFGAEIEDA